jgi:hypothetical protein
LRKAPGDGARKTQSERPPSALASASASKKMGARARRLVESASGVCVIAARGVEPGSDVDAGRSLQRAWLALTRRGLVAQPMMAVPGLEAVLDQGDAAPVKLVDPERAKAVVEALRGAFPSLEKGARIAAMMRFGWGPPPSSRIRRLPLEESLAVVGG